MSYDPNNIFARILRGEIPCRKVYEDDNVLAFQDIHPQAPVHVLIIPKGPYENFGDLAAQGSDDELAALLRAVPKVAELTGVKDSGYRIIANVGNNGHQEVQHLHLHLVGGRQLGRMLGRPVAN
jgi:histidine triad (HIT) family protein